MRSRGRGRCFAGHIPSARSCIPASHELLTLFLTASCLRAASASDHGELFGDHGFFLKCEPYEGSANIPLLIAGSRELGFTRGVQSQHPFCLEDLMPTLLTLAGAALAEKMDGRSLLASLRGAGAPVRPWLHFQRFSSEEEYSPAQMRFPKGARKHKIATSSSTAVSHGSMGRATPWGGQQPSSLCQ